MIYFARDEATLLVKIGFTEREVHDRLREIQTGCPGLLTPLLQMDGTRQDDQAWHDRFAAARERGEWFRPVPELLRAIEEAKASQVETVRRVLQKLREEANSGPSGLSDEDVLSLRVEMEKGREEEKGHF
jgi:hypothetical protein